MVDSTGSRPPGEASKSAMDGDGCYSAALASLSSSEGSQAPASANRVLSVGAAVTGTDRSSIYPFTGVLLAFSSFLYFL